MDTEFRTTPRGTFWLGALVGLALGIPLVTLALTALARVAGVGDPQRTALALGRYACFFAGVPALVTGGGVARLAAYRLGSGDHGPTRASILAMGAAGIGLAYLVAVPAGGYPQDPRQWLLIAPAGLLAGMATGAVIGGLMALRMHGAHGRGAPRGAN